MAEYDAKSALIVVDVQNDFADPKGSLYVLGGEEVVAVANREIERSLAAHASVFYTADWHPESTPHFKRDGGIWPVHCVRGSWGAEFHSDLRIEGEIVRKGIGGEDGYSGFTVRDPVTGEERKTPLEDMLRKSGIERVTVLGLATDYCVKESVLDAVRLGFETSFLHDGIRAVNLEPGDGDRAVSQMSAAGARIV